MRYIVNPTFLVLAGLALVATGVAYYRSPALAWEGASFSAKLFLSILPNMLAGFLLGGMVQVLLPSDLVASYAGEESGLLGLALATLAGAITPGGPFVQFPLAASLWKAGTGIGPITAYLTSWALLGAQRILVWEIPVLGWRYAVARIAGGLSAPFIVGYLTSVIYRRFM